MSRLHLHGVLIAALSCSAWACGQSSDDVGGDGAKPNTGADGDSAAESESSAGGASETSDHHGDGDGDGDHGDGDGDGDHGDGDGDHDHGDGDGDHSHGDGDGDGDGCNAAETTDVIGCDAIVGTGFCSEGGGHVAQDSDIMWGNNPPHSGSHYPTWESWGEHLVPVPRGNWVHNLEHGGLVLLYNCPQPCNAELDVLRAVIEARPQLPILMTEDSLLDAPRFAAVSWTWVYEFDVPVLDELLCFVDQHYDHAPESVP